MLVSLKFTVVLSAKQTCVLAYWAVKAGVEDPMLSKLAVKPDSQSGRFSKVFDDALQCSPRDADLYEVGIAQRLRHNVGRSWDFVPTLTPHEALVNEWAEDKKELEGVLEEALGNCKMPDLYYMHPAVAEAPQGELVHPFCCFVDGLAFGRSGALVGLGVYFLSDI